ncbi:sugar phosphate isomerase/epimerase family protein [Rubellimicrobium roseum]|uniref:Sugar phosphate isomerase/epimerase n=1 Tax=Rubellimicrobium roseum TaxID=687525 RepID=A0A5C4NJK3_9RHOB|nr:sugar phosphate isomerase/epimerase family protein [Rubellimicrobium roseum]TNC73266.1 sugar phosphate isomerase/epimerase [Rubellimicrobium roseum]
MKHETVAPTRQLAVGLNPYGLTYTLGLQGAGTPRANPQATGLDGFVTVAEEIGAKVIEIHNPWLTDLGTAGRHALKDRLAALGLIPIASASLHWEGVDTALRNALDLGATTIRFGLSPVLCGDRNAFGAAKWAQQIAEIRAGLAQLAPLAADHGITVAIENHQDFGSDELLSFCEEAGDNVGITLDTGNSFPVAESPLSFARTVAPRVRHVHLKDYRVQFTDEGYRLVRCAIGDGAVPFPDIFQLLLADGRSLTASLEPGALEARHVRLFTPDWWRGYAPKDARALAETLQAARANLLPEGEDFRTPWERGATGDELIAYERDMMTRSAANMRALGLME